MTHALSAAPSRFSPRETRHVDVISQFTSDIRHVNGKKNPVADALSHMDINALNYSSAIDCTILAAAQQNDPEIPFLKTSSFCLQDVPLPFSTGTILCDISTALPCLCVQNSYRRHIFDQLHSLSHPGIRASQKLITERCIWPGINKDVRQ